MANCVGTDCKSEKLQEQIKELQAKIDRLQVALEWYADEARACAKNSHTGKHNAPYALLASVNVLALDGGKRADEALRSKPNHGEQYS